MNDRVEHRRLPWAEYLSRMFRARPQPALIRRGIFWRGPTAQPRIALTFDDGPDPRWTPAILRILEDAGVRATFFLIGSQILAQPELARQVAAAHEVGTHLHSHRRGLPRDRQAFHDDLRAALAAHQQVLGTQPAWLRFPFGDAGRTTVADWQSYGLRACRWSLNSQDVRHANPAPIVQRVTAGLRPGEIILLHDGLGADWRLGPGHRDATVAALPQILAAIRDRQLQAVTLSDLAATPLGSPTSDRVRCAS